MEEARHKNAALLLLLIILAFNVVDRVALAVMLEDIKGDLDLSDTQLGFITGIAFALFYSVMGIPIGRWADRGNRATIVVLTTGLWSVAVACCAAVTNFTQLLLTRVCVAVGEAGCYPPAFSLISDYFSRAERPRAMARYMLGVPLGIFIGNFVGGWVNELFGWRVTFFVLGVPGLILAVVAALMLKEPRSGVRREPRAPSVESADAAIELSLYRVLVCLWSNVPFRHLVLCFAVWAFFSLGIFQWGPAFFMRTYGLDTGELGTWLALFAVGGLVGTYVGGELASRYAANDERLQLRAIGVVLALNGLVTAGVYSATNYHFSFVLLGIQSVVASLINGPIYAVTQTLVPARMRAIASALVFLSSNLVGLGLGPLAVGALSDLLRPAFGDQSLRYALLACCPGFLWCTWHLWQASRTARDVATAQVEITLDHEPAAEVIKMAVAK
jgi:MFS transporter, Spinster family, sphingosine-1-phosphate transporter